MARVILQGELKPLGLLNVVQILCNASLTGALRIYEHGLTFTVYLDRGYVVSAAAPEQEPLGIKLLSKKRITPEQLDRALKLQRLAERRGRELPIGRVLVHQKMVTQKDLEECVFDQIIETICLSMELPDPYFSFARLDSIDPTKFRTFINFQFALLEAFRIADEIRETRTFDPAAGASVDASSLRSPAFS